MEKYRKADQHYIDEYDRDTVRQLKKLESKELKELEGLSDFDLWKKKLEHSMNQRGFHITGVWRARNKERLISEQKMADENKDSLTKRYPIPKDVTCNECNSGMQFEGHLFKEDDTEILFLLKCLFGHLPKKTLRPDGSEYHFPERKCVQCGGKLVSTTEKINENHFKFTDTCSSCGHIEIDELELDPNRKKNITEDDRKKYCASFNTQRTFYEDLKAIADLGELVDRNEKAKKEKEELEVDKIEKPNIPQLEKKLADFAEKNGFIKFQFDKPEMGRHVVIPFSLQDLSDRNEQDSLKIVTNYFKKELFHTNWRLMTEGISYRLGHLTGRIKSFEHEDDLLKIAKEIQSSRVKS
jgi:hypothetical protein